MKTDLFDYDLPPERIAQTPLPRGESRLLVLYRKEQRIEHRQFSDLLAYLRPNDTLVLNETRVTARRLHALRENGAPAELLLTRPIGERCWEALTRPGKALKPGKTVRIPARNPKETPLIALVIATTPDGGRILEFADTATRDALATWGETPLPPYIGQALSHEEEERYQTVYARSGGSVAAPTAGLHFTPEMLATAERQGVEIARLTLSVGVGTFRPVRAEDTEAHEMHYEHCVLSPRAAQQINQTQGRIIAVGTTSVRTLETAAAQKPKEELGRVSPFEGETNLFLTPGSPFRVTDALITNFHLPRSTLLMLVSAFATRELILHAYHVAIEEKYRFFSFGDAMLIL